MTPNKLAQLRALLRDATVEPTSTLAFRPAIPAPAKHDGMDGNTRRAYLRRIRLLRDGYDLGWLVDETSGYLTRLGDLTDGDLIALQATLDHAVQCFREGIPLEDAGLAPANWEGGADFAIHVSRHRSIGNDFANHVSQPPDPAPAERALPQPP